MKAAKKTDKSVPTTAKGWRDLAARSLRLHAEIVDAIDSATIKKRREEARLAQERAEAYARLGVGFDRQGVGRWIANGEPVIGGRAPRRHRR